ncbi:MAG: hypothetical protein E6I09_05025 [Chloroflexi bacterium]|nr:MAG: hypothetical protein E6I09_05025 [Chloroflexota bacterium]
MRRYKTWGGLVALFIAGLLVASCGRGAGKIDEGTADTTEHIGSQQTADIPEIEIPAAWAYGDAQDLATLTASADAVFRGRVVALKGQHAAIPQSGAQTGAPAPRWADFPVSQFELHVEKVVFGPLSPGSTTTFEQVGGVQNRPDGTQVRLVLEKDELVEPGDQYLFFAKIREDGVLEAAPFARMKVSGDGRLSAGKGWAHLNALEQLSRMSVENAEGEISAAAGH